MAESPFRRLEPLWLWEALMQKPKKVTVMNHPSDWPSIHQAEIFQTIKRPKDDDGMTILVEQNSQALWLLAVEDLMKPVCTED